MSKSSDSPIQTDRKQRIRRAVQAASFGALYRVGGPIYDRFTRLLFGEAWNRWRMTALHFVEDGPVLDLGCGTGVLLSALVERGFEGVGVDREPSMLHRASKRTELSGRLLRADVSILPIKTGSIGTCVSTFPARFILRPETLDEVARVLRPSGRFVVVMGGETEERIWWREPIRLLLRVFYGARSTTATPDKSVLAHPDLSGEWRWVEKFPDRTLIWAAQRSVGETASVS